MRVRVGVRVSVRDIVKVRIRKRERKGLIGRVSVRVRKSGRE